MNQPDQLISGMLSTDTSDHLPMFTFIGDRKCANMAPKYILCRPMDDDKIINIANELNNIDWAIIDHLSIDDAYNLIDSKNQNALNTHAHEKTIKIPYKKVLR